MNLKNKKVIITGATGGIGNSLVKKFTDSGSVVLATGTNEEKLNNLKKQFSNIHIEKFNLGTFNIESFMNPLIKNLRFRYFDQQCRYYLDNFPFV